MLKFDHLAAANIHAHSATSDRDRLLVQLLTTMTERTNQLEARLDHAVLLLTELKAKDGDQLLDFDERVLQVLDVRSGTAFEHIEAEIEDKLEGFLESSSFNEAVAEAVEGSIGEQVKQKLDDILHDAIIDAIGDAEYIVRKGLRSIL